MNPWPVLVEFPGPSALLPVWRDCLAEAFEPFNKAFLEPAPKLALAIECPRRCGCRHHIMPGHNGTFIAYCMCDPPTCPDITVKAEDITGYKPSWTKLTRAVSQALSLDHKFVPLQHPNTWQIGSWSSDAIPAILTIQLEGRDFRSILAQLAARLRQKFILLAPTSEAIDATAKELLATAAAAFFALENTIDMHPDGSLHPLRPPADLFAQFSPSPIISPIHQSINPAIQQSAATGPRFALRKGLDHWDLIFDYQPAGFHHEQGASFVAYLLLNPPPEPLHGLDLIGKIPELYRQQSALTHIADPETGKPITLEGHARIQQRSLALDDKEAMRALRRKKDELQALIDSDDESEPVKAEAQREIEAIEQFQHKQAPRSKDGAHRAPHAIRMAITRFHHHLATALDDHGNPHQVLRAFAEHIRKYILIPSARYSGHGNRHARSGLAGCFTYEPPPGVSWVR